MSKYEFGVMSSKWSLEAKNDDLAFLTMVMFIGKSSIPIAIYSPFKRVISSLDLLPEEKLGSFIDDNRDELIKINESIKEIKIK